MRFLNFSSLLAGLAVSSLVQAVPSSYGKRTDLMPRGLPDSAYKLQFMPKGKRSFEMGGRGRKDRNNKNNNNDVEVDIAVIDVQEKIDVGGAEIDIETKVTQILIKNKDNNKRKDNKRKDDAKRNNKDVVSLSTPLKVQI
jgi:hypothetical protein